MDDQNSYSSQKFKKHLKVNFPEIKKKVNKNGIILVEFNRWCSHHICYGYLINSLKKNISAESTVMKDTHFYLVESHSHFLKN